MADQSTVSGEGTSVIWHSVYYHVREKAMKFSNMQNKATIKRM